LKHELDKVSEEQHGIKHKDKQRVRERGVSGKKRERTLRKYKINKFFINRYKKYLIVMLA
jgi:hypothetical protein